MKLKFRMEGGVLWERNFILMQFVRDIQLGIHVNPPPTSAPLIFKDSCCPNVAILMCLTVAYRISYIRLIFSTPMYPYLRKEKTRNLYNIFFFRNFVKCQCDGLKKNLVVNISYSNLRKLKCVHVLRI
jgi:hypothetical protein